MVLGVQWKVKGGVTTDHQEVVEGGKAGIPGWNPAVMERFLTRKTRKRTLRLRRRKRTKQ